LGIGTSHFHFQEAGKEWLFHMVTRQLYASSIMSGGQF